MDKCITIGTVLYLNYVGAYWICTNIKPSAYRNIDSKHKHNIDYIGHFGTTTVPKDVNYNIALFTIVSHPFHDDSTKKTIYFNLSPDNEHVIHYKYGIPYGSYDTTFSIIHNLSTLEMSDMLNVIKDIEYYEDYINNTGLPYDRHGAVYKHRNGIDLFIPLVYNRGISRYGGLRVYRDTGLTEREYVYKEAYFDTHQWVGSIPFDEYIRLRQLFEHHITTIINDVDHLYEKINWKEDAISNERKY